MRKWAKEGLKAQTCVTSPPYYGLRDYGTGDSQIGAEKTPKEFINNLVEVFACVWDMLSDDGTLWVNMGDSYYNYRPGKGQALNKQSVSSTDQDLPQECARRGTKLEGFKEKDLMGIPWRLAFALQDFGWHLRQDIIWHKPNPMPESVKDRCTKAHEYIFLMTKKPHYYFDDSGIKEQTDVVNEYRNKRSVWSVPTSTFKGAHFATYPTELIEPCILAGSRFGDVVLDPFMGSGTTAQVAQNLGRKYLGCELNPEYKKFQDERLSQTALEL